MRFSKFTPKHSNMHTAMMQKYYALWCNMTCSNISHVSLRHRLLRNLWLYSSRLGEQMIKY